MESIFKKMPRQLQQHRLRNEKARLGIETNKNRENGTRKCRGDEKRPRSYCKPCLSKIQHMLPGRAVGEMKKSRVGNACKGKQTLRVVS